MYNSHILCYQLTLDVTGHTYGADASRQADHSSQQAAPTNVPTSKQTTTASTQAVPVSVRAITHHELGFKAHFLLGMGFNGEVIIVKDNCDEFYLIEHDGNKFTQKYRKNLPDGMDYGYNKAINRDRIFLQNRFNADTICYNRTLDAVCIMYHEGLLLDCIGDKLFYRQGTWDKQDWKISVRQLYEDEESVPDVPSLGKLQLEEQVSVQPPAPHGWKHALSICCVSESYAVVESLTRSLDIFDARGMMCYIQLID